MKSDALKGIKHYKEEILVDTIRLDPLAYYQLPVAPKSLTLEARNSSFNTYVIKVYQEVETVSLPKGKK